MVPVYYVLFTLSSILGGIVLYKEFHQHCPPAQPDCHYTLLFLLGIGVTFLGVYLIAFNRPSAPRPAGHPQLALAPMETEGLLPGPALRAPDDSDSFDDVPLSPAALDRPRSRHASGGGLLGGGGPRQDMELRRLSAASPDAARLVAP